MQGFQQGFKTKTSKKRGSGAAKRVRGTEILSVMLLVFAAGLIMVDRFQPQWAAGARANLSDFIAPLYQTLSKPIQSIETAVNVIFDLRDLEAENRNLRQRLAQMDGLSHSHTALKIENRRLSSLLMFERNEVKRFVTVSIIGAGGAWARSYLVSGGADRGVKLGMVAVDGRGVLGRVVEVGETSSRILLINDINSRIPAIAEIQKDSNAQSIDRLAVETSPYHRQRFVMAGDNGVLANLHYVGQDVKLKAGAPVVTSGDGGQIPQGLLLGHLVKLNPNSTASSANDSSVNASATDLPLTSSPDDLVNSTTQTAQAASTQTAQAAFDSSLWRVKLAADIQNADIIQLLEY